MGLFDMFRRRPRDPAADAVTDADLAEFRRGVDDIRFHHYALAHYALRTAAFGHPAGFVAVLASPAARRFLADMMAAVAKQPGGREQAADFGPDDLFVHPVRAAGHPCAVVEFPPPRATTEVYFVAAVLLADLTGPPPADPTAVPLRYLTLEKGLALGGPPRTVLCEWTADGTHANFGDGPPPKLEDFTRAVGELVSGGR